MHQIELHDGVPAARTSSISSPRRCKGKDEKATLARPLALPALSSTRLSFMLCGPGKARLHARGLSKPTLKVSFSSVGCGDQLPTKFHLPPPAAGFSGPLQDRRFAVLGAGQPTLSCPCPCRKASAPARALCPRPPSRGLRKASIFLGFNPRILGDMQGQDRNDWHAYYLLALLCLPPALVPAPAISVRHLNDRLSPMLPRHCSVPR